MKYITVTLYVTEDHEILTQDEYDEIYEDAYDEFVMSTEVWNDFRHTFDCTSDDWTIIEEHFEDFVKEYTQDYMDDCYYKTTVDIRVG